MSLLEHVYLTAYLLVHVYLSPYWNMCTCQLSCWYMYVLVSWLVGVCVCILVSLLVGTVKLLMKDHPSCFHANGPLNYDPFSFETAFWNIPLHFFYMNELLSVDNPLFETTCALVVQVVLKGTSHYPCFRTPWQVGDAMVGRGNAGWTMSKSGHPCPCQNCP